MQLTAELADDGTVTVTIGDRSADRLTRGEALDVFMSFVTRTEMPPFMRTEEQIDRHRQWCEQKRIERDDRGE